MNTSLYTRRERVHALLGQMAKTAIGWVPRGNIGGATVRALRPKQVPDDDLQRQIDRFRAAGCL